MNIDIKGWTALGKGGALNHIATKENLPCCTLCAMWCLSVADDVRESSVSRYAGQDLDWWKRANVYDRDKPWSALEAIQEKLGGDISYCAIVEDEAPSLTPGRWHVIQRWRKLELNDKEIMEDDEVVNGSYGHTYLAYCPTENSPDLGVKIIQSSIKKGYRMNEGAWEGDAGLRGFSVGVLTLPNHTENMEVS
tara:strand:- start:109 stop:687 length:579 start_codon:yes stop_codon:yes gene_type:complete